MFKLIFLHIIFSIVPIHPMVERKHGTSSRKPSHQSQKYNFHFSNANSRHPTCVVTFLPCEILTMSKRLFTTNPTNTYFRSAGLTNCRVFSRHWKNPRQIHYGESFNFVISSMKIIHCHLGE